jgi:hypothetical protein
MGWSDELKVLRRRTLDFLYARGTAWNGINQVGYNSLVLSIRSHLINQSLDIDPTHANKVADITLTQHNSYSTSISIA